MRSSANRLGATDPSASAAGPAIVADRATVELSGRVIWSNVSLTIGTGTFSMMVSRNFLVCSRCIFARCCCRRFLMLSPTTTRISKVIAVAIKLCQRRSESTPANSSDVESAILTASG